MIRKSLLCMTGFVVLQFSILAECQADFTLKQLNDAARLNGLAEEKIDAIRTFDGETPGTVDAAVLSVAHTGWQLTILHHGSEGFKTEWRSPTLPDDFEVSDGEALRVEKIGDENVVLFNGCKAHSCPEALGLVLYAPRAKQAFYLHYRDENADGHPDFEFSKNALLQANVRYKAVLQNAMMKLIRN